MLALIPWFELEAWDLPLPGLDLRVPIQPFGVLAAVALLVGERVMHRRALATGVAPELVSRFLAVTIPIGLLSAAALNVLAYDPAQLVAMGRAVVSWFEPGPAQAFPYPGLSSFGGFIGGALAAIVFCRRREVSLLRMADLFCYALPFAWLFGRLGCFVVHDHPGAVSDFILAVDDYRGQGLPRHDLGLYEVLWSAGMLPVLVWCARRPRVRGFYAMLLSLAYAPVRFGLDFLRATPAEGGDVRYLGLTPAQYAALGLLLVGLALLVRLWRRPVPSERTAARA